MGLFAFNRARRQAQEATQPDAPADVQPNAAAQEATQPDAAKPKRAKPADKTTPIDPADNTGNQE